MLKNSIADSHNYDVLMPISSVITSISQATDVNTALEPLAQALVHLYQPAVIEILLHAAESDQLVPRLIWRTDGTQDPLFPIPSANPVAPAALRRNKIITMPVTHDDNTALQDITYLVGVPIGHITPEGVIVFGFEDAPPTLEAEQPALTILTHTTSVKLLQLRLQEEDAKKDMHLTLIHQVSKVVSDDANHSSALRDALWLIHQSYNLLSLSLYAGPLAVLQLSLGGEAETGTQPPEGLAAIAYQQQRLLFSNDVWQDTRCVVPPGVGQEARSEVVVPLFYQQQCIGVLDIFSAEINAFNTQDMQTLTTLAHQIAILLEDQLDIPHPYQSSFTEEELPAFLDAPVNEDWIGLSAITRAARLGLHADAVTLFKVQNGKLLIPGNHSISTEWPLGEKRTRKLALESLERHQTIWIGTQTNLPDSLQGILGVPAVQKIELEGRAIAVPIGSQGSESGILVLGYHGNKIIDPTIAGAVDGVAAITAFALQTSEISDDYRLQKQRLALLYEIATDTRKLSSMKEVALKTTEKLRDGMGWARVELYRWDENAGGLVLFNMPEQSPFVVPIGESVVGLVASERRLLSHTPKDGYPDNDQNVYSEMAAPLIVEEQLRGVLYARSHPGQQFTAEEQQILSAVAELLADTLDNVTLYVRLRHQLQEATTLYHITRSLNNTDNMDNALDEVASVILNTIGSHNARISLLDNSKNHLVTKASAGLDMDDTLVETNLTPGKTNQDPLYKVASTGHPIYITDMVENGNGIFLRSSFRSLMAVPLFSSKGEIIGTLSVASKEPNAFSRVDEHLLTVAGGQVAIVIENIQLYKDIEERRKHLRFAYNRLRELTELKDQILQNVSHEIRTPLTLIKGYVELIREDGIGGELTPSQREAIDTISRRADDVVRIVGQIVALQPLSDLSAERTKISVSKLLQEVVDVFQHMISGTPLSLHLDPVDPNLNFYGDYEKIQQLCYNILDNSVKFSPGGGTITVRATPEETYVHMTFADQGIGIDERRLSRIFDTFYQIDGSSTRRFGGLGLGLAVVNRVVESHRGKVWVESELNKGSVFHVLLPQYIAEN
jgi:signal transduction histidine kinase